MTLPEPRPDGEVGVPDGRSCRHRPVQVPGDRSALQTAGERLVLDL